MKKDSITTEINSRIRTDRLTGQNQAPHRVIDSMHLHEEVDDHSAGAYEDTIEHVKASFNDQITQPLSSHISNSKIQGISGKGALMTSFDKTLDPQSIRKNQKMDTQKNLHGNLKIYELLVSDTEDDQQTQQQNSFRQIHSQAVSHINYISSSSVQPKQDEIRFVFKPNSHNIIGGEDTLSNETTTNLGLAQITGTSQAQNKDKETIKMAHNNQREETNMGLLIASEEPESELLTEKDRNQDTIISQFAINDDEYSYQHNQTVETGHPTLQNRANNIGEMISSVISCTDTMDMHQQPQPEPEENLSLTTTRTMTLLDRSAGGQEQQLTQTETRKLNQASHIISPPIKIADSNVTDYNEQREKPEQIGLLAAAASHEADQEEMEMMDDQMERDENEEEEEEEQDDDENLEESYDDEQQQCAEQEEEEEDEVIASGHLKQRNVQESDDYYHYVTEEQAYRSVTGGNLLEQSMQALCMMHNLDQDTCLKNDQLDSQSQAFQKEEDIQGGKMQNLQDMQMHTNKFVGRSPFWAQTKKNQQLQKLVLHANGGSLYESGGREVRIIDHNNRFDYKMAQQEGEKSQLSKEDQEMLGMQPSSYTMYLRNFAQTISRNLAGVDEVITGLDTTFAGGRNAMSNYLNQRYTIPAVRQELCQGLASSKQDISHSLIEKSTVKVTHASLMPPLMIMIENQAVSNNNSSNHLLQQQEHASALPANAFGQGQRPGAPKSKRQEDRVFHIDQMLKDAHDQQQKQYRKDRVYDKSSKNTSKLGRGGMAEQSDDQSIFNKNKFVGKTLDRNTDQWVYLERYVNLLSIRVVRGCLKMAQDVQEDFYRQNNISVSEAKNSNMTTSNARQSNVQTQQNQSSKFNPYLSGTAQQSRMAQKKGSIEHNFQNSNSGDNNLHLFNSVSLNYKNKQDNASYQSSSPFTQKQPHLKPLPSTAIKQKQTQLNKAAKLKHQLTPNSQGQKHISSIEAAVSTKNNHLNYFRNNAAGCDDDLAGKALTSCQPSDTRNKEQSIGDATLGLKTQKSAQTAANKKDVNLQVRSTNSSYIKGSFKRDSVPSSSRVKDQPKGASLESTGKLISRSPIKGSTSTQQQAGTKSSGKPSLQPNETKTEKSWQQPKDVVKVVAGSTGGNGEHNHDEYWEPVTPGKEHQIDLNQQSGPLVKKLIKRKLRKSEYQMLNPKKGANKNASAAAREYFQDQFEVHNLHELKVLLKFNKDIVRKNHYQHMHAKPLASENQNTKDTQVNKAQANARYQNKKKEYSSSRTQDVQSEMQIREQQQKTRMLARNVITSKEHLRGKQQLIEESSESKKLENEGAQSNEQSEISVRQFRVQKSQQAATSDNFGSSAWKIPHKTQVKDNEQQIRIRVHKEGKAYTKKVKIEKAPQPPPVAASAFTTQYNASKSVFNVVSMAKSTSKEPRQMIKRQPQHQNVYNEKLPPLLEQKQHAAYLKSQQKSASQGATYKRRHANQQQYQQFPSASITQGGAVELMSTNENTTASQMQQKSTQPFSSPHQQQHPRYSHHLGASSMHEDETDDLQYRTTDQKRRTAKADQYVSNHQNNYSGDQRNPTFYPKMIKKIESNGSGTDSNDIIMDQGRTRHYQKPSIHAMYGDPKQQQQIMQQQHQYHQQMQMANTSQSGSNYQFIGGETGDKQSFKRQNKNRRDLQPFNF